MSIHLSTEHVELRRMVRRFLQEHSAEAEVRRIMETSRGYDPDVWSQMADQLGLQSLIIPEVYGGSGFSFVELMIVLEEMGSTLFPSPYFESIELAAHALRNAGDESAMRVYLPGIASGQMIATLAVFENNGSFDY